MTKARVLPVTPDGKKYERRSYSDGERRRAGAEERERPTTSGYGTSLRERHTGFSPVRHQVRPSTAGPTSNRENLAVYLERMERILAEVQATHTDLVSRRNNRRGSRSGSNRSSPANHEAPPPHQVATVPLDIEEILADASIEPESPAAASPGRRLRDVLDVKSSGSPAAVGPRPRALGRERIRSSVRQLERHSRRRREAGAQAPADPRPGTASKRTSALKKLRRVSARKRTTARQVDEARERAEADREPEGIVAVTSSTFCLPQGVMAASEAGIRRGSRVEGLGESVEGPPTSGDEGDGEQGARERILQCLGEMDDRLREALAANLRRALVRRRLNSKLGRGVVADIRHLVELIEGFGGNGSSPSGGLHNAKLELKMKTQFSRDLKLKKRELVRVLTTSRPLKPRVLRKPAVPVTPLKRVSKSLRIRNRPDTAPAAAPVGKPGAAAGRRVAWGEKENTSRAVERQKKEAGATRRSKLGVPEAAASSGGAGSGEEEGSPAEDRAAGGDLGTKGGDSLTAGQKKAFLKRKRAKVKMYKIPNYSHVKPLVDSRHLEEGQDDQEGYAFRLQARPSTAPVARTPREEGTPASRHSHDSPLDDLKEILGLSPGKEAASVRPRSAAGCRARRRRSGSNTNSSTHLSGTVTRLFSSSVQRAREAIARFEEPVDNGKGDGDGNGAALDASKVPNALQSLGLEVAGSPSRSLRDLAGNPQAMQRVSEACESMGDFVVPNQLSFVHFDLIQK